MKRLWIFTVILFIFTLPTLSNPIAVTYFNEIQVFESDWKIELYSSTFFEGELLDSSFLVSKTDTAFIKPFYLPNSSYIIITPDSLQSNFAIDPDNDTLLFYLEENEYHYFDDWYVIGTLPCKSSQSYSLSASGNSWYIDNSPTFGYENDTDGAIGEIKLLFEDKNQNPIPEV